MRIYLCNHKGDVGCGCPCRVFGFDGSMPDDEWEIHTILDFSPCDELIDAIVHFINACGNEYSDRNFTSELSNSSPDSMKRTIVSRLSEPDFSHISYTMFERVYHLSGDKVVFHDEWIETRRKVIVTSPLHRKKEVEQ